MVLRRISASLFVFVCLLTFLASGICSASAQNAPRTAPPNRLWLSLGYSTLDTRAVDFNWLQEQCKNGRVLKSLQAAKPKLQGLVVPVFDDGRCFYATAVAPFAGRNPQAASNEKALRELLEAAQRTKTPIYLGLDVLAWQKTEMLPAKGIFASGKAHRDWQEVNVASSTPGISPAQQGASPEAFFASPFHPGVRASLTQLVREVARKFPSAAGIALNVRLSDRDILGYSTTARRAALLALSIDPLDLSLSNRAELTMSLPLRAWIEWRQKELASLVKTLGTTYRSQNARGKVILSGVASYPVQRDFNDLRRSQDWQRWSKVLPVEAVLLEGHWLPRFEESSNLESLQTASSTRLVPQSLGNHLISDSQYALDWAALKSRAPQTNELALYARSESDLRQAVELALRGAPLDSALPQVGTPFPDWVGREGGGQSWDSRTLRGKKATVSLLVKEENTQKISDLVSVFAGKATLPAFADTEFFLVSAADIPAATSASARIHSVRASGEILRVATAPITFVLTDRAGFLRRVVPIKSVSDLENALSETADLSPNLQIGAKAPVFSLPDMNGRLISQNMLIGRKNLLLTWFPKCFTGGCAQQLASLRDSQAAFAAADTEIVAISVDPPDTQRIFAANLRLPFVLLPDTRRHLSLLYGAVTAPTELAGRQSVLIDKQGIVRIIDRAVDTHTHGPDLLKQMQELGIISAP